MKSTKKKVEAILTPKEIEHMEKVHDVCLSYYLDAAELEPYPYNPWDELGYAEAALKELGVLDRVKMNESELKEFIWNLNYYFL
jgi:hypothetical protein